MNRITVKRIETIDEKFWRMKPAPIPPDNCRIIMQDTILEEKINGKLQPVIGYYNLKNGFDKLVETLKRIRYQATERTGGLPTKSRIFGSAPRVTIRKDYCSRCEFTYDESEADSVLKGWGEKIQPYYKDTNRDVFNLHCKLVEKILPEWKIGDSIWTQGIVNWNNQLRFHKDQGNFPDTWSAMLVFRRDIEGGWLYMPRYNIALMCGNGTLTLFNGQDVLHGVTPIRKLNPSAYRYSIVYYSLKQMVKCMSTKEELSRIRKVKTERERNRVSV